MSDNHAEKLLTYFDDGFLGDAVDIGAYDGVFQSNTQLLEELGWNVLCIEPNPDLILDLRCNRPNVIHTACASSCGDVSLQVFDYNKGSGFTSIGGRLQHPAGPKPVLWVPMKAHSLNCLLPLFFANIDLLCIDTEGDEPDILRGINLTRWTPKVICVENNFGEELASILEPAGYAVASSIEGDAIFTRRDHVEE